MSEKESYQMEFEPNSNKSIYINKAGENWVVDRFRDEWKKYNNYSIPLTISNNVKVIWLMAPWTWRKISKSKLSKKIVICTIHHIDEQKFDKKEKKEFLERDKYVDYYHAISLNTEKQIKKLTTKKIFTIPFWLNNKIFFEISNKQVLRKKYEMNNDAYLVGSFQRDTEGKDLISPKLSKGPDLFINHIEKLINKEKNLEVVLTGKRRNYVINELSKRNIKYHYFEMISFEQLNELYNLLDLYLVTSRYEGGPQAILEAGITKTPIISTDVGIAKEILSEESIIDLDNPLNARPNINYAFSNVQNYLIPKGFDKFNEMFSQIV